MIIAFPPCTHLASSGARHFEKKREDGRQRWAIEFFCKFLNADCDKVVIENPVGIISGNYIKKWFPDLAEKYNLPRSYTQIIQPYEYGHKQKKTTCLWIKGLPALIPTQVVNPEDDFVYSNGKHYPMWMMEALKNCKTPEQRSRVRSRTFDGVARAMAEQWG
jgi:site-specific DNA-cytosine methylase